MPKIIHCVHVSINNTSIAGYFYDIIMVAITNNFCLAISACYLKLPEV